MIKKSFQNVTGAAFLHLDLVNHRLVIYPFQAALALTAQCAVFVCVTYSFLS